MKIRWAESGNSRIMNPPLERIDQFWIRQTEEIIASAVRKIQDQVGRVRKIQDQVAESGKFKIRFAESENAGS